MIQTFLIKGITLDSREYSHSGPNSPLSHAFFCERCGEIWGRVLLPDTLWMVHSRGCSTHAEFPFATRRGTLWAPWMEELRGDLPPGVVAQEARQLLENFSQ